MSVRVSRQGPVAVLSIDNPPLNVLSVGNGTVLQLHKAFKEQIADKDIQAIVLTGQGGCFSAGADIADFDRDPAALDGIRDLLTAIEDASKPVVAALHGHVLGGGLELALACHYRLASTNAKFAFPEITLGLLPGGGGTQRIGRLVEMKPAIKLMLDGRTIDARAAADLGLIDRCVEGDQVSAAVDFAQSLDKKEIRRTGRLPIRSADARSLLEAARADLAARNRKTLAASHLLECVEASVALDLRSGLAREAQLFSELMGSEPSLGLRHAFYAERAAGRIPGLSQSAETIDIKTIGVIGAGTMGTGIALAALAAGLSVTLVELRAPSLEAGLKRIGDTLKRDTEKGRLTQVRLESMLASLHGTGRMESVADADLIIEAVFEDLETKRNVFAALDKIAKPSALLASNTSTLDVNSIADATSRPAQVVGMHFFSPANLMKLLEIVRGARTSDSVLSAAMKFARRIGKVGVVAGVCDGFIGNRLFEEYLRQAYFLLEDGALPQQVDRALEAWGMAMGPFRVMDLAGQDIGWSIRKRRAVEQPDRPYSRIPDIVCEMGRFGQKTGAGFYNYPDGRSPIHDPEIDALVERHSAELGIARRTIGDEEIMARCVLALVNEGAKALEEGIALRPLDVDVVYLNGYGFPRERGGPMFYADRLGLTTVLDRMRGFEMGRHGHFWKPANLLSELVARGENLGSLNAK